MIDKHCKYYEYVKTAMQITFGALLDGLINQDSFISLAPEPS